MFVKLYQILKRDNECAGCSVEIQKASEDNKAAFAAFHKTLNKENQLIAALQKISKQVK